MTRTLSGSVVALWRYPVSSLAGERLALSHLTQTGVAGDRDFGLFDAGTQGILFPSRDRRANVAPLAAARIGIGTVLELSVDGERWAAFDDISLQRDLNLHFGRKVQVHRYGDALGDGTAEPRYERGPIHLLSLQAMQALQERLPNSIVDVARFRPNVLVDLPGTTELVPEELLIGQEFRLGALRLRGTVPRDRCSFTALEQRGLPEDKNILRALIAGFEKNFGILCDVLDEGDIAVGAQLTAELVKKKEAPIVIVGAGQAGAIAARAMRDLGSAAPIDLFGEEHHAPYERPPLSKSDFVGKIGSSGLTSVLSATEAETLDIALHLGARVAKIDRTERTIETEDGTLFPYSRLILATGGTARRVPRLERGYGRVHAIRTAEDAEHLHRSLNASRRVFVLGGGWLGLEVAATARSLGRSVTLFARQRRLCSRVLPSVVSDYLVGLHEQHGVRLRLGEEPVFREHADRVEAEFADGNVEAADMLVVAIGMRANESLARQAGLACADGIFTDPDGATDDPAIFAIGDVARQRVAGHRGGLRLESWHNANDQAYRLARHLLALEPEITPVARFWSHQYDAMLQVVGLPDSAAEPVAQEGGADPYWEFDGFAVGVNRARKLHRFAATIQEAAASAVVPVAPPVVATAELIRLSLGRADHITDGKIVRFEIDEVGAIAVTRCDGRLFAVNDTCPHVGVSLSQGFLENGRIVCPSHFAEFDPETGAASNAPPGCTAVACYFMEEVDGEAFVLVPQRPIQSAS